MGMWLTSHIISGSVLGRISYKINSRQLWSFQRKQGGHCWKKTKLPLLWRRKTKAQKVSLLPQITEPSGRGNVLREGAESEILEWVWREAGVGAGRGSEGQGTVGHQKGIGLHSKFNGQQLKGFMQGNARI